MRIRLPMRRTVFFGTMFVLALIVFLPMRLALGWLGVGEAGVSAREARGSVWAGRLTEARLGGAALGDLEAGLSPFQLLVGRARIDVARDAGGEMLRGAVGVSRNSSGIDDLTGLVPVGNAFSPLPVVALGFTDFTVRFVGGACRNAEGVVRAVLGGEVAGISLAQGLAGAARCDGAALLLPLAGQSGQERVDLRITDSGSWTADIAVRTEDPVIAARLAGAGFVPGAAGYTLRLVGGG